MVMDFDPDTPWYNRDVGTLTRGATAPLLAIPGVIKRAAGDSISQLLDRQTAEAYGGRVDADAVRQQQTLALTERPDDPNPPQDGPADIQNETQAAALGAEPKLHQNLTGLNLGDATSTGKSGYVRYQMPGGEWREYNPGGATKEARMGETLPNYDPGPPVSQSDVREQPWGQQPESWHEDPLEQSAQAAELKRNQALAADPWAKEHSDLAAQLGLYAGKQGLDLQRDQERRRMFAAATDREAADSAAAKAAVDRNTALAPKDRELRKSQIDQRYRERINQLAIAHGYARETIAAKDAGGFIG